MRKIDNVELVENMIEGWTPSDLVLINNFEMVSEECTTNSSLIITALFQKRAGTWPNFSENMFKVAIEYSNVVGLSLKGFGGGVTQIMGFDILSISDRGLEGMNYEIIDYEDNRISFNCESIKVISVSLIAPLEP